MIRVALVDDHYAVRLGLEAALNAQPDMVSVGAAACAAELPPLLYRTAPDVLIVDYRLPDDDGLTVCLQLEAAVNAPAVLVHSAFADDWLTVPALVAGANGILNKGVTGRELAEAIRLVAAGEPALPPVSPEVLVASGEAVGAEDQPILGMLMHGVPTAEICSVLGVDAATLRARRARMLTALRASPDRWAPPPIQPRTAARHAPT
jgi:DNA-binding NarL/FixJ family response regulator